MTIKGFEKDAVHSSPVENCGTLFWGITDVLLLFVVDKTLLKEFQPGVVTTPLRNFFYKQNSKWPPSLSRDS
jgi:hypothetical protein